MKDIKTRTVLAKIVFFQKRIMLKSNIDTALKKLFGIKCTKYKNVLKQELNNTGTSNKKSVAFELCH